MAVLVSPMTDAMVGGVGTEAPVKSKHGLPVIGTQTPVGVPEECQEGEGRAGQREAMDTGQVPVQGVSVVPTKHPISVTSVLDTTALTGTRTSLPDDPIGGAVPRTPVSIVPLSGTV